jgi:hypothetical protein
MKLSRLGYALTALLVLFVAACATDPVVQAKDVELKAQALFAEYVIAEEAAVVIMRSPDVPDNIKAGIKQAHAQINPLVEALQEQRELIAFLRINKPEDVAAALLALDQLITNLDPLVKGFSRSVGK